MNAIKKYLPLLLAVIVLAALLVFFRGQSKLQPVQGPSPEIAGITATEDLDGQVKLYRQLIERVGPIQAQEELLASGLPFTGQTHLLNHTVGDVLYEKFGAKGLVHCKEYFLASCYHGFILHIIGDGDSSVLKDVFAACRSEGLPVIAQCSHALGHGFLADSGYKNLPVALKRCDELTKMVTDFPLYNCHDGVFMENIWAVHEGSRSADVWLSEKDLIYPCSAGNIADEYKNACWSNQPAYLYQEFDGNISTVSGVCTAIENQEWQQTCFNGLSRQIHPIAAGSRERTFQLCSLLLAAWQNYCVTTNAISSFSVGDRKVSYELCAMLGGAAKVSCYQGLFGSMSVYAKTAGEYQGFCQKVLEPFWREQCFKT